MTFDLNYIIYQFSFFLNNYFFSRSLWCNTIYWRVISKAIWIHLDQFLKIFFDDFIVSNDMDNHLSKLKLCFYKHFFFLLSIDYTLKKTWQILLISDRNCSPKPHIWMAMTTSTYGFVVFMINHKNSIIINVMTMLSTTPRHLQWPNFYFKIKILIFN